MDDTVMADGHTYSIVENDHPGSIGPAYLRQEGTRVLAFDLSDSSLTVLYDFSKSVGDTMWVYPIPTTDDTLVTTITFDGYGSVFGRSLRLWDYYTTSVKNPFLYSRQVLADSVGVVHEQYEGGVDIYLRGAVIDGIEYGTLVSVPVAGPPLGKGFRLLPNYPNPFNPSTKFSFDIAEGGHVSLTIHDVLGREVAKVVEGHREPGRYTVEWNAGSGTTTLSSGVYLARLQVKSVTGRMLYSQTTKIIAIK